MRLLLPGLALLTFTACWEPVPADYRQVLPDQRLEIDMPVADTTNQRSTEWSDYYLLTAQVTGDVNRLIGGVLLLVNTVTRYPASSYDGETAIWGPYRGDALSPVESRLLVRRDAESGGYTWNIEQRPSYDQTDEAWVAVLDGEVDAGATQQASTGWFSISFDQMTELDPTVRLTGEFSTDYQIAPDRVAATAGWTAFQAPTQQIDAWYSYDQVPGGDGSMDLTVDHDMNANGVDEHHQIHSQWTANGAGRSDAVVDGPDLGEFVATATECWDQTFTPVFQTDNWSGLPTEGEEGACVVGAEPVSE